MHRPKPTPAEMPRCRTGPCGQRIARGERALLLEPQDDDESVEPELLPEVWEPEVLDLDDEPEPERGDFWLDEDESES